ncbi:MAG: ABC transporter ATP-binding protein [Acetobacteraceae bacterium]|nr:ABC transporter ATP-binding protein [Acetobacteraceae bacterium]
MKRSPLSVRALAAEPASSRALLGRLWREHVHSHTTRLLLVLALTALMAGTTALYPVVIEHAFDMFAHRDQRILYQIPALVVLVSSVKAAAQYFQNVEVQRVVLLTIRGLQERMFAHLARADLARIERDAPAQIAARFTTDAAIIRDSLTRAVNGVADAVTVVGLIASMLYLDWLLSLIAAALYPLAAVPIQRIGKRVRRASGGMQERVGEAAALLNESFAQARTVRAYRLEEAETARAEAAFAALYRALLRMSKSRSRVDPVLEVLGGGAVALVIGFAGWRAAMGTQTIGNFTGFVAALLIASRPLRALGSLNAAAQEGLAGLARVFAVLDEKPRITDSPDAAPLPAGAGRVSFHEVRFTYPDGRTGLDGLSFAAAPGATVALVGHSGSGKSTALALILRLHDVTAGAVRIDGADVRAVTLASLREAIAYVSQDALLFDDTIGANIRMGRPGATDAEIEAAAKAAAGGFIAELPDGFATRVGPGGQRLSGGQRQRVALARALLRDPRILLLDEATSALDAESEAAVQAALARLREGRTTIVVAHRLSTVRDADLIVVLADGRVVEQGTHASLLAEGGLYARLLGSQMLTS